MSEEELSDDELLARLASAASRFDPPPAEVVEAARASFAWRDVDSELAELVFDSSLEREAMATMRGGRSRLLTFEGPGLVVEVEVDGGEGHVVGQLVPPQPAQVELRRPSGSVMVDADELGRFTVDGVTRGPVSLRCRRTTGEASPSVVDTAWVVI